MNNPTNIATEQPEVETIDMTPTWADVLPILILGLDSGNAEGRKVAREELKRMADAADKWNTHVRASKPN